MSKTMILGFLAATIVTAMPVLFPALGEVMSERAGVLNLSLEGCMLSGSLAAFLTVWHTNHLWLGVLVGMLGGLAVAAVMAIMTITLLANQIVTGTVLNILVLGTTNFIYSQVAGNSLEPPHVSLFSSISIPLLDRIPYVGSILFQNPLLVYLGILLVPVSGWFLYHTRWGLTLRATGEDPRVVASVGRPVAGIRYRALLYSGLMAGLGGAYLALAQVGFYTPNLTAGRGYVAIAVVVFGGWNPYKILAGATFFGCSEALEERFQALGFALPSQFFLMLPYILVLIALLIGVRTKREVGSPAGPRFLTVPYEREAL